MPTIHFFFVGTHSKTHLGFQRDGKFLWLWVSNRCESALLAEDSKGDTLPWREASNGGQRPTWQEESKETGGFVAHDFAHKVWCVMDIQPLASSKVGSLGK